MDNVVLGRLCQDPVLRQPRRAGQPMAMFTVAVNRWRKVDKEVVERAPVFHRVVCYGPLAENVSNSLRKGMEVLAVGEWVDDSYSDATGQRRIQIAMEARAVGPALRYATAQVHKVERRPAAGTQPLFDPTPAGDLVAHVVHAAAAEGPPAPGHGDAPPARGRHALITEEDMPVAATG